MKLRFRTKPWPHQKRVLVRMIRQRGGGIQVPMRWGKSWIGVNWAGALYHLEGIRRVLVITVTSGLGVWEEQVELHCPKGVSYQVLTHEGELVLDSGGDDPLVFMVVNYQNLYWRAYPEEGSRSWVIVENGTLKKFKPEAIIADESHHLGDPTAEQSKYACKLARQARFRLFMTGTMFHRKPFYVFGQVKFYDDGRTFGTAWGHFKNRVAIMGGYMNYEVKGYRNMKWMMREIRKFTYIERYIPHHKAVVNRITFRLEGKNLKAYQQMEKHRVLHVGDEILTSEIILTQHLRCLQIAGGFVKTESGYKQVGNSKLRICEDRLREYLNQDIHKVVVGCRFIPELQGVAKVGKKLGFKVVLFHGGLSKEGRKRRIAFFQDTDSPCLFISQIATGKESINLSVANTMMFYSLTESYVEFDQFRRRIELYGEKRTLMYDFLLGLGTRDVVAYESMRLKMDVADFLVDDPARVEQLLMGKQSSPK